ncbi:hypothetical protein [Streptomyces sp. NPDC051662]|uniref:hypothetical protein n=1 Tax=Streptomyces sp. NPDC051662 TaxID=3154750 RepID=UPI00343A5D14
MTTDLKKALERFKVGDYVSAAGVDTRGHSVTRTGTLLALPADVTATRNGVRSKGVRVCVGAAGVEPKERSTWTTLFPDAGRVELAEEPKGVEWSNSELRTLPGVRASNHEARFHFGGKGGKRSSEPNEPVILAGLTYTGDGKYDIFDEDTGDVVLTCTLQSRIWWAPTSPGRKVEAAEPERLEVEEHQDQEAPLSASEEKYDKAVRHVRTGEVVGFLSPGCRFTPIAEIPDYR